MWKNLQDKSFLPTGNLKKRELYKHIDLCFSTIAGCLNLLYMYNNKHCHIISIFQNIGIITFMFMHIIVYPTNNWFVNDIFTYYESLFFYIKKVEVIENMNKSNNYLFGFFSLNMSKIIKMSQKSITCIYIHLIPTVTCNWLN